MEVKIVDTAYGGYGIARNNDGKVIFIPHSVEGDILDITLTKENKKFSYAVINKIIKPSQYRIKSKCQYAGICGGCVFNHINYSKQLDIKKKIVLNSVRNIDYKKDIKIIYNENSNYNEGYRLRVNMLAVDGNIGFYKFKTNDFVGIDKCSILKDSLFKRIKNFALENNVTGNIYAIENNNNKAVSFIEVNKKINIKYFDGMTVKYNKNIKKYGIEYILYKTKYGNIPIGHKTFFQSNLYLLDSFQDEVIKYIEDNDTAIIELYAGSGFFTVAIKNTFKNSTLISSEINKDSVYAANRYSLNITNEDSLITLKKINYDIDALIVDPPREGIDKKTIKEIIRIRPKKIIYVSCDPMTFSRDINILKDYYKIIDLNIIDMFADTYHIELISYLKKI